MQRSYEARTAEVLALATNVGHAAKKADKPLSLNILTSVLRDKNLRETAHSRILYDLLQHPIAQESFVRYFFPEINISGCSPMRIPYPDYQRIDLTLKGTGFFIIIENKVNRAGEQPTQIKRYIELAKKEYPTDRIYVLYLNRDTEEEPTTKSLPAVYRAKIGDRLVCKSYKNDIIGWLKVMNGMFSHASQPYLKSALLQYQDYLEQLFNISQHNNDMKTQIDGIIEKELGLADDSLDGQIEKLKANIDDAALLLKRMEKLLEVREELRRKELYPQWFNMISESLAALGITLTKEKSNEIGFDFIYRQVKFRCCISDEPFYDEDLDVEEIRYYWGVCSSNGKAYDKLFKGLRNIVLNGSKYLQNCPYNSEEWAVSDYAPINEISDIFVYLAQTLANEPAVKIC